MFCLLFSEVLSELNKNIADQATPVKQTLAKEAASPMQMTPAKPSEADDVTMVTPQIADKSKENGENSPNMTPVAKINDSTTSIDSNSAPRRKSRRFSTPKNKTPSGASPSRSATK